MSWTDDPGSGGSATDTGLAVGKGVLYGIGKGGIALVSGLKDLAVGGYNLATDPAARDAFAQSTKALAGAARNYADDVMDDRRSVIEDAKSLAASAKQSYLEARDQARAQGLSDAEFNSRLAGRGVFEAALLLAPVAKIAEVGEAGKVAEAARAAEVAADAEKAAQGAKLAECPLEAGRLKSFLKPKLPGLTTEPGALPMTSAVLDDLEEGNRIAAGARTLSEPGWPTLDSKTLATFKGDPAAVHLPEGAVLRRVVGQGNNPAGGFWVRADNFPATEAEWRSGAAVRGEWNGDGAYTEYVVPKGGMNVWSGAARAQQSSDGVSALVGGTEQIVLDSTSLPSADALPIKPTGW